MKKRRCGLGLRRRFFKRRSQAGTAVDRKGVMAMTKRSGRSRFIFLCLAAAVILFTVFMLIPTMNIFRMSLFVRSAYSTTEEFVWLQNFSRLMADSNFIRSMQNTILLIVVVTVVTFGLALIFAAILSREKIKGQNFFRIIFYIPNILSVVVISAIFSAIYDTNNGTLNSLLSLFKGETVAVLWKGEGMVMVSLIIAMVWQAIGYYMVMYMASMASVPQSLYESASLDGAGRLTQFFQITLPLIWTNIRTTLTFFIISTINMAFLFVKAMTSGGPNGASEVALSYMYKQAYTNSTYGYGMAIGVMVFLFSFGLSALVNVVTKREPLEF
ncbi:putative multiple-sugar transport system permease YteP [Lachnospiraceae bacterium]|jgi:N-acetylglucosamine transport system permease protein|nr:putative multiple-sugar transport system permease YteP [Lachnospiraceae bacterium]